SEMDVSNFQKQTDGSWQPRDAAGQSIPGMANVAADRAAMIIGPAVVDSAPETGITTGADDSGLMRLVGESRERISTVSAPLDTPEAEHMQWIPGTPVSAVGDFEYAVEGTLVESLGEPQVIYRKNSDNSWSLADASGVVTSDDRVSSADLANGELEFRVHTPSTAAGMEFPAHTLSDRGELEFLPV